MSGKDEVRALNINIPKKIYEALDGAAKETGETKTQMVCKALIDLLKIENNIDNNVDINIDSILSHVDRHIEDYLHDWEKSSDERIKSLIEKSVDEHLHKISKAIKQESKTLPIQEKLEIEEEVEDKTPELVLQTEILTNENKLGPWSERKMSDETGIPRHRLKKHRQTNPMNTPLEETLQGRTYRILWVEEPSTWSGEVLSN